MRRVVTLMTDFGTADGYVAQVKGVLLSLAPEVNLVDITHDIPPQDVEAARLTLARYWRRFPAGTIHLVVVDPGVGSSRAALAVRSDERILLGPDNGVLSPALLMPSAEAVSLTVPPNASPTFHGRDIFAPFAATLAGGAALSSIGTPHPEPIIRRTPEARRLADGTIEGQVIAIDRFGNCITNLVATLLRSPGDHALVVAGKSVPIRRTYSDVGPGEPVALAGSSRFLEVAVRNGSAASALELQRGSVVRLR